MALNRLVFVDTEASGPCPGLPHSAMTELGAVHYESGNTFYARFYDTNNLESGAREIIRPHVQIECDMASLDGVGPADVYQYFKNWLWHWCKLDSTKNAVFVSDNLAFDWQWVNYGFHLHLGEMPFGFSGRRINDFYAGLVGDFTNQSRWKKLRVTTHDHNPVNDAMGNVEAFRRILNGER